MRTDYFLGSNCKTAAAAAAVAAAVSIVDWCFSFAGWACSKKDFVDGLIVAIEVRYFEIQTNH